MAQEADMDGGSGQEIRRMLHALKFEWGKIPLVAGNSEANFARMMASLYSQHLYNPAEMERAIKGLMSGFEIQVPKTALKEVKVGPDNLRMSLFLLKLALDEADGPGANQTIIFQVRPEHHAKAEEFFEGYRCVDARMQGGNEDENLKRFFSEEAVVVVYLAEAV